MTTFLTALTVPEVRAALQRLGFEERDRVRGYELLSALTDGAFTSEPAPRAVERDLWAWYLEWSRLAKEGIQEDRLLRRMGLLRERRVSDRVPVRHDDDSELTAAVEAMLRGEAPPTSAAAATAMFRAEGEAREGEDDAA